MSNRVDEGVLAYLGKAIWTLLVREYLVEEKSIDKLEDLQKESLKYIGVKAQSSIFIELLGNRFFTSEEIEVYKRGRNFQSVVQSKNFDFQSYRVSTGFEVLIGHWHIEKQKERIEKLWEKVKTMIENKE
ncbi:MAG TPA: Mini-ribonuclease 3 [Clostridium sp.]|nr:Mini-ribonuclease 3 [Clostridium sp.]